MSLTVDPDRPAFRRTLRSMTGALGVIGLTAFLFGWEATPYAFMGACLLIAVVGFGLWLIRWARGVYDSEELVVGAKATVVVGGTLFVVCVSGVYLGAHVLPLPAWAWSISAGVAAIGLYDPLHERLANRGVLAKPHWMEEGSA